MNVHLSRLQDNLKKASISQRLFGEEDQKVEIPEDYTISFPEDFPEEQVRSAKEMFVKNGLSKDDAQLLTNSLVQSVQQNEDRIRAEHEKRCDQDIKKLKEEYGSDNFVRLNKKVRGFVKEAGLSGETFDMFITCAGAYDSFKLLEQMSRATRDANYTPPPPSERSSVSSKSDASEIFNTPEFADKLFNKKDPTADRQIQDWAKRNATSLN